MMAAQMTMALSFIQYVHIYDMIDLYQHSNYPTPCPDFSQMQTKASNRGS